jgi:hypothetical protein
MGEVGSDEPDGGTGHSDATLDGDVTAQDAMADTGVTVQEDAGSGVDTSPHGPVLCRTDDDCPGGLTCKQVIPGGVCEGCSSDSDCGHDSLRCEQDSGRCLLTCEEDSDCNVGTECDPDVCVVSKCELGESCPDPYNCSLAGQCSRQRCGENLPECDNGLECQAEYCVE